MCAVSERKLGRLMLLLFLGVRFDGSVNVRERVDVSERNV